MPDLESGTGAVSTSGHSGGRALILVVEKDEEIRELERYFLEGAGFAVEFAEDGDSALEKALSLEPDVVVTEILVPRRDGLSLCRALKAKESGTPPAVLVFSFLAAEDRARDAGADAFLMKPLARRALIDVVETLLRLKREQSDG